MAWITCHHINVFICVLPQPFRLFGRTSSLSPLKTLTVLVVLPLNLCLIMINYNYDYNHKLNDSHTVFDSKRRFKPSLWHCLRCLSTTQTWLVSGKNRLWMFLNMFHFILDDRPYLVYIFIERHIPTSKFTQTSFNWTKHVIGRQNFELPSLFIIMAIQGKERGQLQMTLTYLNSEIHDFISLN